MNKFKRSGSSYLFILPYAIIFGVFVVLLLAISFLLSFTYFDSIHFPTFAGLKNYIVLFTQDVDFMQHALPNAIKYALIVGPGGYLLAFTLAWILAQLPRRFRNVAAIILYSPSLTGAVLISVVWRSFFSGDNRGILNFYLLELGLINKPVQWLQSPNMIFWIMVIVGPLDEHGHRFSRYAFGILNINPRALRGGLCRRTQEPFPGDRLHHDPANAAADDVRRGDGSSLTPLTPPASRSR